MNRLLRLLLIGLCIIALQTDAEARSHHSSSGHSYSSVGFSSHSYSSGSSSIRSSSGGGSKSFTSSGSGRSYSSGGNSSGYSSGKSYSSGADRSFTPASPSSTGYKPSKSSSSSGMSYDAGAARASKEAASKQDYSAYKQGQQPKSASSGYSGGVPPVIPRATTPGVSPGSSGGGYYSSSRGYHYYPDANVYRTRSIRINHYYAPYYSRPIVIYHDNYSSYFWWWLLDQSLDDRAYWTYHHRLDMDAARYQSLLDSDINLQNRVHELEQQQIARDPGYVPAGLDRDLMYSDQYVNRAYNNRPTRAGVIGFWIFMVPGAIGLAGFFLWLIFFKRWQTSS